VKIVTKLSAHTILSDAKQTYSIWIKFCNRIHWMKYRS